MINIIKIREHLTKFVTHNAMPILVSAVVIIIVVLWANFLSQRNDGIIKRLINEQETICAVHVSDRILIIEERDKEISNLRMSNAILSAKLEAQSKFNDALINHNARIIKSTTKRVK